MMIINLSKAVLVGSEKTGAITILDLPETLFAEQLGNVNLGWASINLMRDPFTRLELARQVRMNFRLACQLQRSVLSLVHTTWLESMFISQYMQHPAAMAPQCASHLHLAIRCANRYYRLLYWWYH